MFLGYLQSLLEALTIVCRDPRHAGLAEFVLMALQGGIHLVVHEYRKDKINDIDVADFLKDAGNGSADLGVSWMVLSWDLLPFC